MPFSAGGLHERCHELGLGPGLPCPSLSSPLSAPLVIRFNHTDDPELVALFGADTQISHGFSRIFKEVGRDVLLGAP